MKKFVVPAIIAAVLTGAAAVVAIVVRGIRSAEETV